MSTTIVAKTSVEARSMSKRPESLALLMVLPNPVVETISSVCGLTVPVNRAAAGGRKSREHAQERGLTATGFAEQGDDLSRVDGQIDGRNDSDAAAIRLRIVPFQLASFNDGLMWGVCGV
jgi:hypothetical protein